MTLESPPEEEGEEEEEERDAQSTVPHHLRPRIRKKQKRRTMLKSPVTLVLLRAPDPRTNDDTRISAPLSGSSFDVTVDRNCAPPDGVRVSDAPRLLQYRNNERGKILL